MKLLTKEQQDSYENAKICCICKEKFENKYLKHKKFKKQFICLGENTEKYITFTVPVEKKVTRIDKNGKEIIKNIS